MTRRVIPLLLAMLLLPATARGVPRPPDVRLHPDAVAAEPSYVGRVAPALVGLHVRARARAASSERLGARRFATAVVFDPRGYAVTVAYAVMDAVEITAQLRDDRVVAARPVALDLETGLAVVRLEGAGPWPAARLGDSTDVSAGTVTATVGVDEDNALVHVTGAVAAVRRFSGYWEYMLDRAFLVFPGSSSWGGAAVVDLTGSVIGIAAFRLGAPPHVNLAVPIEQFWPVKDELIAAGRALSRPPRAWLGLHTMATPEGVFVDDFAAAGPARRAGFVRGDRIVAVNGVVVQTQEEFYEQLWKRRPGDVIRVAVRRDDGLHVIAVRAIDHYDVLHGP